MDKYGMLKQFMHNELGITKEDIQLWIKEAAQEEGKRLVNEVQRNFNPQKIVESIVWDKRNFGSPEFTRRIESLVAHEISERLAVKVVATKEPTDV